jgi:hypothetical protein
MVPPDKAMEQHSSATATRSVWLLLSISGYNKKFSGNYFLIRRTSPRKATEEGGERFFGQAMELPAGPERHFFLRSVDVETQRLMAGHALYRYAGTEAPLESRRSNYIYATIGHLSNLMDPE